MFDIHVPAHEPHLKPQDGGVLPVVGQDEFDRVTVRHPSKSLAETHMAAFIDTPIAGEAFAQVGMQPFFVATCPTAAECDWMQSGGGRLRHKIEAVAAHTFVHGRDRWFVVGGLQGHIPESVRREIRTQHEQFAMIIALEAWIVEDGLFHLVKSSARRWRPHIADWFCVILKHDVAEG